MYLAHKLRLRKSKWFLILLMASVAALIAGITLALQLRHEEERAHTHYHTGFVILLDGKVQDFSGLEHMYMRGCGIEDLAPEEIAPSDRVHLHAEVGNIAHVHDAGVTWQTLLDSLRVTPTTPNATWYVYVNGRQLDAGITTELQPYESAVVSDTQLSGETLSGITLPTQAEIEQNEQTTTENCGVL